MTQNKPESAADLRMIIDIAYLARTERRWFWGTFAAVLLIGLLYLNLAPKQFEASLFVAPADIGGSQSSRLGAAAGVASSLGISLGGADSTVSAYDQFINTLSSPDVAGQVMKERGLAQAIFSRDWDVATKSWRQNPSVLNAMVDVGRTLLGRPGWTAPTPERLADYISKNLSASKVGLSNIYRLQYRHSNPKFARYFLDAVYRAANELIRQQYLTRINAHMAFLSDRMSRESVAEVRMSLALAIEEDAKQLASASSGLPFAARAISVASVEERPVSPSVLPTLLMTIFLGLIAGFAVSYFARYRRNKFGAVQRSSCQEIAPARLSH
ncbi:MAG: hypothetical protein U1E93_03565 [Alphaproteobacteria bacterium]